jgi:hypothetical protein
MLLPPLAYSMYVFVKDSGAAADGRELSVLMVQPNVDPWRKFDANTSAMSLGKTLALTDAGMARHKPDLIIWPEMAVPYFFRDDKTVQEFVKRAVSRWDVPLLTGTLDRYTYDNLQTIGPLRENEQGNAKVFNAGVLLTPEPREADQPLTVKSSEPQERATSNGTQTKQRFNVKTSEMYRKRVLMPFAERVPFVDRFPALSRLAINFGGLGALSPGHEATVFSFEDKHGETVAKLIHAFLYRLRRPLGQTQRYAGTPLMKKWSFAAASLVALIGVALVIGSSAGSYAVSPKLPAFRPAVPAAAAAPLNSTLVGDFTSAIEIGGVGTTQIGGTAIDASGNLYVTGGFTGSIVFNTAPQTTLTSTQDDDVFVAKYDSNGHPVWARVANGATGQPAGLSLDGGLAVAVDGQGNSYVGGGFVKTLSFKDGNNNTLATLNASGSMLNFEPFVAKYATNGTLLWAVGGMSGSPQHAGDLEVGVNGITDIVVDGAGNPYVGGDVAGTNFLGTPVSGTGGVSKVLVSRLNPATGAPVWVSVTGGAHNDGVLGLGIDSMNNLYVMGDISSTTTFPTQPPTTLTDSNGFENPFVAKYNKKGQCLWAKQRLAEKSLFSALIWR